MISRGMAKMSRILLRFCDIIVNSFILINLIIYYKYWIPYSRCFMLSCGWHAFISFIFTWKTRKRFLAVKVLTARHIGHIFRPRMYYIWYLLSDSLVYVPVNWICFHAVLSPHSGCSKKCYCFSQKGIVFYFKKICKIIKIIIIKNKKILKSEKA